MTNKKEPDDKPMPKVDHTQENNGDSLKVMDLELPKWVKAEGQFQSLLYVLYHTDAKYEEIAAKLESTTPTIQNLVNKHKSEVLTIKQGNVATLSLPDHKRQEVASWIQAHEEEVQRQIAEHKAAEEQRQQAVIKEETRKEKLESFFRTTLTKEINRLAQHYPSKKSVHVDYLKLTELDKSVAEDLIDEPMKVIDLLNLMLREKLPTVPFASPPKSQDEYMGIHIRIVNFPEEYMERVAQLNSGHIHKPCYFEGTLLVLTDILPRVKRAVYKCKRCKAETVVIFNNEETRAPFICQDCQRHEFTLVGNKCTFVDWRKVQLQEPLEKTEDSSNPPRITAWVEGDETADLKIGETYKVFGVLETRMKKKESAVFSKILRINHIEPVEKQEEMEITEEEMTKITTIAAHPELYDSIIPDSWSPSVYGYKNAKIGAFLNVVGGNDSINPTDNSKNRASIHVLYIGEPGTAKSKLAKYTEEVASKCIYTSGGGTTGGGLTTVAEKSDFGEGGWVIKAGALVIASGGNVIIDEFDKMSDETRASIHEAMEQQTVSVAKAGINTKFTAQTNILAVANPKYSRFDRSKSLVDQFNITPSLLSRFDLIFVVYDDNNPVTDREIAEKILENRCQSLRNKKQENVILPDLMSKYIYLAKRKVPTMSKHVRDAITDYYLKMRSRNTNASVQMTARQLEAVIRISEAFAKGRLSDKVEVEDAERAIKLMESTLKDICSSDGETIDVDMIMVGHPSADRYSIQGVLDTVKELCAEWESVSIEQVVAQAEARHNIKPEDSTRLITEALEKGDLHEYRKGYIKLSQR
jgi:replicative DNA helicase Mcm